jgi:DNA-binding transcriptional LysR family regulator
LLNHDALHQTGRDGEPAAWILLQGERQWQGTPPGRAAANSPELLIKLARAGAGIAVAPDVFAAPSVRRGELRRVLPDWCLPATTAWAVFPGRRLMPAKTRAFIDMLEAALGEANGVADGAVRRERPRRSTS